MRTQLALLQQLLLLLQVSIHTPSRVEPGIECMGQPAILLTLPLQPEAGSKPGLKAAASSCSAAELLMASQATARPLA